MNNLALWESVCKTDPKYTKKFSRGGGFSGTATNATYLARQATEKFGPIGIGWGVEIVDEAIMHGAPIGEGVNEQIHKVRVRFWYVHGEQRGEVYQFGQTTFVGKNKNGYFTDEEAPKKSLTDAMSKCLSLLGFSADIYLGLYDDNKYVASLRKEFSEQPVEKAEPPRITEQQASDLRAMAADVGVQESELLKMGKLKRLEDLTADRFDGVVRWLENRRAA